MDEIRLSLYEADLTSEMDLPYSDQGIKAGFPSPAQDYLTESIDLNKELIRHKECTFYARVSGTSMQDADIGDGDLVVIDKLIDASDGDIVAAFVNGEFTLKEFRMDASGAFGWLIPANKEYSPIKVSADDSFMIWGVVTYCIKKIRR